MSATPFTPKITAENDAFLFGAAASTSESASGPCAAALDCVKRGWAVLPCEPNGKLPDNRLVDHGVNSATKDPEVIKRWFARYPDINYAVAGGDDSNLSFYDFDDLYDDDTNVDYSESRFPGLHKSFRVRSGRVLKPGQVGGFHLYADGACQSRALFADAALPLTTRPGVKKDGSPLLDQKGQPIMQTFDHHDRLAVNGRVTIGEVRSRGEYVVGYGSHHKSGRDYELIVDAPLFPNPIQDVQSKPDAPAIGTDQQNQIAGYVEDAFRKAQIEYKSRQAYQDGFKWLVTCPWEHEHTGGKTLNDGGSSSAVFMAASGALGYRCLHAHCQSSRNWEQFRKHMESIAGKLSFTAVVPPKPAEPAQAVAGVNPTQNASAATNALKLNLIALSDIDEEIQEWLWKNRIPKNALSNISGDSDKGKSLVLYDLLARISSGADMPDGSPNPFDGQPKKVILLFSEGSLKTTVKPRMRVMGANMANVLALQSVSRKGETDPNKRLFSLEQDLNLLRQALQEHPDVVLIGFDPITNYLGDKCDMNKAQHVRRVLTPLGELAEACKVTVTAIIHFNKARDMSAMHRTGGAAAWIEVPRAAWCCLPDDDPEHKGEFVFVPIKGNLGKRVGGLRFRIEETFIDIKGQQASEPQLIWGAVTDKTADDLLSVQNDSDLKGIDKAKRWLAVNFPNDMARESKATVAAAKRCGVTFDCLKKARVQLRMETKKLDQTWYMRRRQPIIQPWSIAPNPDEQSEPESDDIPTQESKGAANEKIGTLDFEVGRD